MRERRGSRLDEDEGLGRARKSMSSRCARSGEMLCLYWSQGCRYHGHGAAEGRRYTGGRDGRGWINSAVSCQRKSFNPGRAGGNGLISRWPRTGYYYQG